MKNLSDFTAAADHIFKTSDEAELFFYSQADYSFCAWGRRLPPDENSIVLDMRSFFAEARSLEAGPRWDAFAGGRFSLENHLLWQRGAVCSKLEISLPESSPKKEKIGLVLNNPEEDKNSWLRLCDTIADAIKNRHIQKAVPARWRRREIKEGGLSLSALALRFPPFLHKFLWKRGNSVFFGASPELLFEYDNGGIFVPAIAGTRPRGASEREDAALELELIGNRKERAEHEAVCAFIRETLSSMGAKFDPDVAPGVLKLPSLQHLFTPFHGRFTSIPKVADVIGRFHPSPATGGLPQRRAESLLREKEGWDRGFFAAPLTHSLPGGRSRSIVAIRSGLIEGSYMHFFAGAGFVEGSDPEKEWAETCLKMRSLEDFVVRDGA